MNKLIRYLVFHLIPFLSFTQEYIPFPEEDAIWAQQNYSVLCYNELFLCSEYQYTFHGDTMIGNKGYKVLFRSGYHYDVNLHPSYFNEYAGGLRQEAENRTVYFIEKDSEQEQLLYDFNLNSGDTLPLTYNTQWGDYIVVSYIDSVLIGNHFRKRYNLENTAAGAHELVEGIGSDAGLIEPLWQFEDNYILTCFNHGDSIFYPEAHFLCDLITGIKDLSVNQISLEIIPNPIRTISIIKITGDDQSDWHIEIRAISGQIVKEIQIKKNTEEILNRNEYMPGVYICVLRNSTGQKLKIKKLVVI